MNNSSHIEYQNVPTSPLIEFLKEYPANKIYHFPAWNKVVQNTFGHSIDYLSIKKKGNVTGVLSFTKFTSFLFGRFAVSQPFVNYGGPLLQDEEDVNLLVTSLMNYLKRNNLEFIELRMNKPLKSLLPVKTHKVTFHLNLPGDHNSLLKSFKAKLRSQIRRPLKEEMFSKCGGIELLNDYYKVFSENMRDLGTPVLPKSFFRNILVEFPDSAFIVVCYSKSEKATAASFLIKHSNQMEIPWASALKRYNKYSPNMLLYWESLKLAIEKGCETFDFGRCTPDSGTYKFKKQWGAQEKPLYWYYVLPKEKKLPDLSPSNPKYNFAIKIWQKLPVFIANYFGPKIIKHLP